MTGWVFRKNGIPSRFSIKAVNWDLFHFFDFHGFVTCFGAESGNKTPFFEKLEQVKTPSLDGRHAMRDGAACGGVILAFSRV